MTCRLAEVVVVKQCMHLPVVGPPVGSWFAVQPGLFWARTSAGAAMLLHSWEVRQALHDRGPPCAAQAAVLGGACAADPAGLPLLRGLRAARLHLAHPGPGGRHGSARCREQHRAGECPLLELPPIGMIRQ